MDCFHVMSLWPNHHWDRWGHRTGKYSKMSVSPSPASHLFFDRLEKFVFKKSWIENFIFQVSKLRDFAQDYLGPTAIFAQDYLDFDLIV